MKPGYVEFNALTFTNARDLRTRGAGILNQGNKALKWKVRIQATLKELTEDGKHSVLTTWITCNEPCSLRNLYGLILQNLKDSHRDFSEYKSIMVRITRL